MPIAYDLVIRRKRVFLFIKWSLVSLITCLVSAYQCLPDSVISYFKTILCKSNKLFFQMPLVIVDSRYYGGLVIAPLNIILYNVFSDHGPNIYGMYMTFQYIILIHIPSVPHKATDQRRRCSV